jgi:endo-1,4-beta-xylanase
MKMKRFYIYLAIFTFSMLIMVSAVWSGSVTPGKGDNIAGGKFGEVYECAFPNTVVLDGNLNDLAWQYAPWHTIESDEGTQPATNAKDATCSFAAVADSDWLYVALEVTDDTITVGETMGNELWKDDSVEVYIDANNGETATYEPDDAQITIGAVNIDLKDIQEPELGGMGDGATTGTQAAVVETATGWAVEAAIPLENDKWNIVPKDGLIIGFNVHFNDDDDGGDRDHKLIWSLKDVDDQSWQNTTRFADLKFVNLPLSVDPVNKLDSTWGSIKRNY